MTIRVHETAKCSPVCAWSGALTVTSGSTISIGVLAIVLPPSRNM
ncbi:MAG: hypothetical protein M5U35_00620 [Roseovarius sp.]|nr:hypothetical protein [Roseovarius sp.]